MTDRQYAQFLIVIFLVPFVTVIAPIAAGQDSVDSASQQSDAANVSQATETAEAEVESEEVEAEEVETEESLGRELNKAVAKGDREKIRDLLAKGADINAEDSRGLTPYMAAQISGDPKLAKMLEVLGAKADAKFDPAEFIDRSLKREDSEARPGVAVLIARGDDVLYSGAVGLASVEHGVPITTDTKFRIGSVSKQFTAASILKLKDAGKLKLEDTLSKYVTDFPRGDEVTIHHMLTHTSGLKNYTSDADFFETAASEVDTMDMVAEFKKAGFDSEPGEKFAYCNTGYYLLCHIVEQVSGQSFGDYMKESFFVPLKMKDTGTHESSGVYLHEATGYSMEDDKVTKALDWDMSRARGAGDIYSTVNDLHKWNRGVFGGKVLSKDSLDLAHQIQIEMEDDGAADVSSMEMPYGYGWMIDKHRGLNRVWHSGGLNGFVSQLAYYPDQEVTVVALHNAFPSIDAFNPGVIANKMAEVFLYEEMEARPQFEIDQDVDPETYDDYVGQYDYGGAVMTVTRDGGKLMAQLTGQPNFQIFPSGDDKFFWKVVNAQAEFQRDDDGRVTGVKHSQGIAKFLAPRLEERTAVELTEEQLDRFVGDWKYGIGRLSVRREGAQLFAKMSGQPEYKIFAESENKLFWKVVNAQLVVEFDDAGGVVTATHFQSGQEIEVKKVD